MRRTNVWHGITFQLERAYEDGHGSTYLSSNYRRALSKYSGLGTICILTVAFLRFRRFIICTRFVATRPFPVVRIPVTTDFLLQINPFVQVLTKSSSAFLN